MSRNLVILIGNLGGDVEVKTFDDGNKIGTFSLATSESYKNKQGEKITNTEWHRCVVRFTKQVETMEKYLSKGDKISITGSLKTRSYEDKDGKKVFMTEIMVKDFTFEGKAGEKTATTAAAGNTEEQPDDLPF